MRKRLFDLTVAAVLLLGAAPLLAVVALALRWEGRGPVFHRSPRLGRRGRVFHLVRFRTMVDGPADRSVEERLTGVGRVIRNYSLDDLPNLLNVLRGELSLVGPRPTEPGAVDLHDPAWQCILTVRPGLVSYAVLRLARRYNGSSMAERQRLELLYVHRQSLAFDLLILRAALRAVVASRGNIKARGRPTV